MRSKMAQYTDLRPSGLRRARSHADGSRYCHMVRPSDVVEIYEQANALGELVRNTNNSSCICSRRRSSARRQLLINKVRYKIVC